jgi:Tn3 transposase DDE domain
VLADATNLGLTRMAEACLVASYRQLAWMAAWHLREETYRRALAILVNAQQPLAALFGAADVSSSDGQHFPTAGPGLGQCDNGCVAADMVGRTVALRDNCWSINQ